MMHLTKHFEHLKIRLEAIISATNNFADESCIGRGGFGKVYKGELLHSKGKSIVALKRLDRTFGQGNPEFWKEIIILSLYKHENIVRLYGFCDEGNEKILVYEYASRRSLDLYLNNDDLTWIDRLKICIGAARGLAYLHNPGDTHQRALHRDIKSSNILLDENWTAKISDLGLSKLGPANQQYTFLFSNTVGTIGYIDPLYIETGLLTKESDVYSFGVVLFEVLCGRLCASNTNDVRQSLTGLVRRCYKKNKINEIVFGSIRDGIKPESLEAFTSIAYRCLKRDLGKRPLMIDVVRTLENTLKFQHGPGPRLISSGQSQDAEDLDIPWSNLVLLKDSIGAGIGGVSNRRKTPSNQNKIFNPFVDQPPSPSSNSTSTPASVLTNSGKQIGQVGKKKYVKEATGRHNDTELHLAARRGDLAVVKQILDDISSQMVGTYIGVDFDMEVAKIRASVVNEVNGWGETTLYIAAEMGHLEVVKELLKYSNKETICKQNRSGFDPLHVAASQGHYDVVRLLLDYDVTLCRTTSRRNTTPLITAASRGHIAIVNELLSKDSTILNISRSDGKNALHLAARLGHVKILKTLLDKDPQLARRIDKKGQTALHCAAKGASSEVVKLLVEVDAAVAMLPDKSGLTALHVATRKKRADIVNQLLSLPNMNVNALTRDHKTALDMLKDRPLWEESAGADIRASLLRCGAVSFGIVHRTGWNGTIGIGGLSNWRKTPSNQYKNSNPIIDIPPSPSSDSGKQIDQVGKKYLKQATGKRNDTELHLAARRGDLAVVKQILNDIDAQMVGTSDFDTEVAQIRASVLNEVNESGETALYTAAEMGHLEVVKELLKYSDMETICRKSRSAFDPFHIAASHGHHAVVKLLIDHDVSLCLTTSLGNTTTLITAASKGHTAVVNELLSKAPAMLYIARSNGKTALHIAAGLGHVEILKTLLDKDPQLARRTDKKGQTALHCAAKGDSSEVFKLLLEVDAAVAMLPDNRGLNALHVATRKKRADIVNLLLSLPDTNVNALTRSNKTALDILEDRPSWEESAGADIRASLLRCGAVRAYELYRR